MRVFNRAAAIGAATLLCMGAAAAADPIEQQVRRFADMTVPHAAGGDKVLTFARRRDELIVTGMQAIPSGGQPQAPASAIAVMRTRAAPSDDPAMPAPADFTFVRGTGIRLFVVGIWTRPATMWEIERHSRTGVRFRTVDARGRATAWAVPVEGPAQPIPAR